MQAHRDWAGVCSRHEGASLDALLFQPARIHEVVDEERQLVHPSAGSEQIDLGLPDFPADPERGAWPQAWSAQNSGHETADGLGPATAIEAPMSGPFEHRLEKPRVIERIISTAIGHEGHRISIATSMPNVGGIERNRGVRSALDLPLNRPHGDRIVTAAERSAPAIRLELKGGEANDIAVADEEGDDVRDLLEVAVGDRRVEHDTKRQSARPLDILLSDCIERRFAVEPPPLLRHIHMKGDVDETGVSKFREQFTLGTDAICK